jgi:cation:H+ antiporter
MSVSASKRGEGSVAVVNGVGSNTFDITMCIGIPGLIYTLMKGEGIPISIPDIMPTIIILLISCLLIIRCALSGLSVNKNEGLFLCLFYLAGMVFQILRLMPPS